MMQSKMFLKTGNLGYLTALLLSVGMIAICHASLAHADAIYMYRQPDGSIRFTNKLPPSGAKATVFTGREASFSFFRYGNRRLNKLFHDRYEAAIQGASELHDLDPALIKAVIHAESAFNPRAVSRKGAVGLMQLMPATARDLGVRPHNAEENIHGGVRYLAGLLRKFSGNLPFALAAYNAGEENVRRYGGIPPFSETRMYVKKVLALKDKYSSHG
jgi:hypothetical protein